MPIPARSLSGLRLFAGALAVLSLCLALHLSVAQVPARSAAEDSAVAVASPSDSARTDTTAAAAGPRELPASPLVLPTAAETTGTEGPARGVPLFLGGEMVSTIRTERAGIAPAERVQRIRERIDKAIADERLPADSVRIVQTTEGFDVRLGSVHLWTLTWGDIGASSVSLQQEASDLRRRVREGIEAERDRRRPLQLLFSAGLALLLTFLLWIAYRALRRLARRASAWARTRLVRRLPRLSIRNFEILTRRQTASILGAIFQWLHLPVFLILVYFYLGILFSFFPWTQLWGWILFDWARRTAISFGWAILSAIPQLVVVVFIFTIARWLSKLAGRFFDAVESGAVAIVSLRPELSRMNLRLVRLGIWLGALIFAYPFIPGSGTDAFKGISVLLGLMVSLGSTGLVGNAVSGIVLSYMHSYSTGDRVRIGENLGNVITLGFLATKMKSVYNEELTIPNSVVLAAGITNYTRHALGQRLLLHTQVTIGYDAPWRQVHALLIEAASGVEGIDGDPAPEVLQRSLNDFHVTYELRCATQEADRMVRLYSDLHAAIQDAFARAGVEILSPSFTNLRDANAPILPEEPKGPRPEPGGFRVRTSPTAGAPGA